MINQREIKRKVWHALWGITLSILILKTNPFVMEVFLVGLLILLLALKSAYAHNYKIELVDDITKNLVRKDNSIDGAIYFILGALIVLILFNPFLASISVMILGVSDSLATIVGVHSKHKIYKNKTLEGSLAFFISSFLIVLIPYNPLIALIIATITTLIELFGEMDDNILIPIATAVSLILIQNIL